MSLEILSARSPGTTRAELVGRIMRCLRTYPYCLIVDVDGDADDPEHVIGLSRELCSIHPDGRIEEPPEKVSFTEVQNNENAVNETGNVTRLSRTHIALPPHTDSSYMDRPHELVAFQMVRSDAEGGRSIMVAVDDILRALDDSTLTALREPVFPFGKGLWPILSGEGPDERIRFYEHQLNTSQKAQSREFSERHQKALTALEELLAEEGRFLELELKPGQIMLMNNAKVLHGRTGFPSDSDRLLYRIRLHAPMLKAGEAAKEAPAEEKAADAFDAEKVKTLIRERKHEEALELCAATLLEDGKNIDALLLMARALRRSGRHTESLRPLSIAAETAPKDPTVLRRFGNALLREGEDATAMKVFKRLATLDPENADSLLSYSALLREEGRYPEARALIYKVYRREPIDAPSVLRKSRPTILRLRGMQSATFGIVGSGPGEYHVVLQGGHFSINDLVDESKYNMIVFNMLEDNINKWDVPEADLVLNTVACPDTEADSLLSAARFLDTRPDVPVINHPRQVYQTARDRNRQRLTAIEGVRFPLTERVRWDGGDPRSMVDLLAGLGLEYPVIVRRAGSQTGLSVKKAESADEVIAYFKAAEPNVDYYAIQYADVRTPAGYFNKSRIFCIGGNYFPVANLFVDDWSVHSGDRYQVMDKHEWMQREERRYLEDPVAYLGTENFERLRKIRDVMQLDFFGIDYTLRPDGELFIFEVNPAMRHNYDHAKTFPYTEPHLRRISNAFDYMVGRRVEARLAETAKDGEPIWTATKAG